MGLLNTLIDQAKNPRGFVGNIMIKIMNQAHTSITAWGLKKISDYKQRTYSGHRLWWRSNYTYAFKPK